MKSGFWWLPPQRRNYGIRVWWIQRLLSLWRSRFLGQRSTGPTRFLLVMGGLGQWFGVVWQRKLSSLMVKRETKNQMAHSLLVIRSVSWIWQVKLFGYYLFGWGETKKLKENPDLEEEWNKFSNRIGLLKLNTVLMFDCILPFKSFFLFWVSRGWTLFTFPPYLHLLWLHSYIFWATKWMACGG